MAQLDIVKLIGEATAYDKKLELEARKPRSWCKSISAFANGDGGALIFGVANDGDVVGQLPGREEAIFSFRQNAIHSHFA